MTIIDRKQKEAELHQLEKDLNAELDAELAAQGDDLLWPKACWYIIPNEFGERFNFYGSKPLFSKYLAKFYGFKTPQITIWTTCYTFLTYFLPLLGAAISDSYLGKFWTIIDLSVVYGIGTLLLALLSVPNIVPLVPLLSESQVAAEIAQGTPLAGPFADNRVYQFWTFLLPMILMAIGAGGIKPCVSAHGGDQFLPNQRKGLDYFFSIFYLAINLGSLISGNATPYMRMNLVCWGASCYFSAYFMCSVVFIISMIIFALGHPVYRIVPPRGEFLPWKAICLTFNGLKKYLAASKEERKDKGVLDFSRDEYGDELVDETRNVGRVLMMLLPIVFFWSQNEWQFQYNMMYPTAIPVEAFGNMNSIFVLIMVPAMIKVYEFLEARNIRFTILQRMGTGFALMNIAWIISTILQIKVIESYKPGVNTSLYPDKTPYCSDPNTCISAWWLVPQWFLLSLGEAMLSPEGLKLTYMNVGPLFKSQSISLWLAMSGLGNLFTMLVTAATAGNPMFSELDTFRAKNTADKGISLPARYMIFMAASLFGNLWFVLWAKYVFKYRDESCALTNVPRKQKDENKLH